MATLSAKRTQDAPREGDVTGMPEALHLGASDGCVVDKFKLSYFCNAPEG